MIVNDHEELKRHLDAVKARGGRVIFANGCFDVLHVGHVRYLEGAKGLGDALVVAVNDDSSIRAIKGPGRPLTPQDERAELVDALRCVDFVTLFRDPDVRRLLLLLKPHVQAKGTDYTVETVPERDTVLSYGGEVAITGDPKDHSSSGMIGRLRKQ